MTVTCPSGHSSEADDYCDVCGMPIDDIHAAASASDTGSTSPAPASASGTQPCPNCSFAHLPEALFCEACGYDFTTDTMPRSTASPSATADGGAATGPETAWVVEVWIDPEWYDAQESPDPMPSPGLPEVISLRAAASVLIGRSSRSRNIHPDVACEEDTGISRRQAQLTSDGTRWWIEDLDSANGTFVGPASGPLPETPITVGQKTELDPDDRVYLGAWTRLVVRQATDQEK